MGACASSPSAKTTNTAVAWMNNGGGGAHASESFRRPSSIMVMNLAGRIFFLAESTSSSLSRILIPPCPSLSSAILPLKPVPHCPTPKITTPAQTELPLSGAFRLGVS
ncbi:hypothetical protein VIGAN_11168500 [Vigna angularis var. angularis]|uniref:Uncharacterized protein n=1 Tax=Vigna angularis var. angularis TaxID=157739 RepID=A0A0S3TAI7_PHAAN|nr:hypothetical protein VIGAN_11168500 [Vigna angularis var. angularis]